MDVAEELLDVDRTIDRSYVERRLDDWRARVGALYADIAGWLPPELSLAEGVKVPILEDLMSRFEVPQQAIPSKVLLKRGTLVGRIEPRGLWIVGANGRVDLILPDHHSIIVDRAQSFDLPEWVIMPLRDRLDRKPLSIATFRASLG